MFSYTGLTAAQVERLKTEFGIYAVSTGRICVAALNTRNIDYVAKAIATVITPSLPTLSMALAMISPMLESLLAEMEPTCAISLEVVV